MVWVKRLVENGCCLMVFHQFDQVTHLLLNFTNIALLNLSFLNLVAVWVLSLLLFILFNDSFVKLLITDWLPLSFTLARSWWKLYLSILKVVLVLFDCLHVQLRPFHAIVGWDFSSRHSFVIFVLWNGLSVLWLFICTDILHWLLWFSLRAKLNSLWAIKLLLRS